MALAHKARARIPNVQNNFCRSFAQGGHNPFLSAVNAGAASPLRLRVGFRSDDWHGPKRKWFSSWAASWTSGGISYNVPYETSWLFDISSSQFVH